VRVASLNPSEAGRAVEVETVRHDVRHFPGIARGPAPAWTFPDTNAGGA
jgi:hypothetical protein